MIPGEHATRTAVVVGCLALACLLIGCTRPSPEPLPAPSAEGVAPEPAPSALKKQPSPVMCLVDARLSPADFAPDGDVAYRDDGLVLRRRDGRLLWEQGGASGVLYESPPLASPDPDGWDGDRLSGSPQVGREWVVFFTTSTPWVGSQTQVYLWHRSRPADTVVVLTEDGGTTSLRGSQLAWSRIVDRSPGGTGGTSQVMLTDLATGRVRTLSSDGYAPALVDDDTVVWLHRQAASGTTWAEGVDLRTGEPWRAPSGLAGADVVSLAGDGDTVAAVVDLGTGDAGPFELLVWNGSDPDPLRVATSTSSITLSLHAVRGDAVAFQASERGVPESLVVNVATGVVHRIHEGWSSLAWEADALRVTTTEGDSRATSSALVPMERFGTVTC